MCSLAPCVAVLGMGVATAFLDWRRGVAVVALVTHSISIDLPAALSQKRGRDVNLALPALQAQMDVELVGPHHSPDLEEVPANAMMIRCTCGVIGSKEEHDVAI